MPYPESSMVTPCTNPRSSRRSFRTKVPPASLDGKAPLINRNRSWPASDPSSLSDMWF